MVSNVKCCLSDGVQTLFKHHEMRRKQVKSPKEKKRESMPWPSMRKSLAWNLSNRQFFVDYFVDQPTVSGVLSIFIKKI